MKDFEISFNIARGFNHGGDCEENLYADIHYAPVVETTGYVLNIEMKDFEISFNIARGFNHGEIVRKICLRMHYAPVVETTGYVYAHDIFVNVINLTKIARKGKEIN